jgi:hypothetical protein
MFTSFDRQHNNVDNQLPSASLVFLGKHIDNGDVVADSVTDTPVAAPLCSSSSSSSIEGQQ